jgi:hypothetical protein
MRLLANFQEKITELQTRIIPVFQFVRCIGDVRSVVGMRFFFVFFFNSSLSSSSYCLLSVACTDDLLEGILKSLLKKELVSLK